MDSNQPIANDLPLLSSQMLGSAALIPGIFPLAESEDDFLSSLDSDTRDYVMKHTNEFRSKNDIINCVNKLRNGS